MLKQSEGGERADIARATVRERRTNVSLPYSIFKRLIEVAGSVEITQNMC